MTIPYDQTQEGIYFEVSYGSGADAKSYALSIGSASNQSGVRCSQITNLNTDAMTPIMYADVTGDIFHTFQMVRENAASTDVSVYVDGIYDTTISPATGTNTVSGLNRLDWGAAGNDQLDTSHNANARWSAVSLTVGSVPEPSALVLLAIGLLSLLAYAWRKRK